jgi:hypothetical protein
MSWRENVMLATVSVLLAAVGTAAIWYVVHRLFE